MGSVGQERKEFVCDCRWKIFGSLVLQDRYDLRFFLGIQRDLFGTGMEDHHNVADLFQMVRTHGKWGCGNMVPPCYHLVPLSSARFCLL